MTALSWRRVGADPKRFFYSTFTNDATIDADSHTYEVDLDGRTMTPEQALELGTALIAAAVLAGDEQTPDATIGAAAATALASVLPHVTDREQAQS